MATASVSNPADYATQLRAELKEWERAFAAANGGKKAGRNDIKQAPEIGRLCLVSLSPATVVESS
jgi:hypothetical protein